MDPISNISYTDSQCSFLPDMLDDRFHGPAGGDLDWDAAFPSRNPIWSDPGFSSDFGESIGRFPIDDVFPGIWMAPDLESAPNLDDIRNGIELGSDFWGASERVLGKIEDWATRETMERSLADRAGRAFAEFGESDVAIRAARDLQWGRALTSWASTAKDALGFANDLRSREAEVLEMARAGDVRGAAAHTWGSAASLFGTAAISMAETTSEKLGLGDVVARGIADSGIEAGLYRLGSMTSDVFYEYQLATAIWLSEQTGRPLRPGVQEQFDNLQSRR